MTTPGVCPTGIALLTALRLFSRRQRKAQSSRLKATSGEITLSGARARAAHGVVFEEAEASFSKRLTWSLNLITTSLAAQYDACDEVVID